MVHCFVTQWAPNELGHNHYGGEGQLKESYLLDKRVMVGFEIVGFCACITMFFYSGGWSGWTPENCDTERRRGYSAYTNTVLSWTRCVLQLEWATCSGKFNFPFVYSEEDQSCLPNSRVGRSTARAKSTVTAAKGRSGGIVYFATYYVRSNNMEFSPLFKTLMAWSIVLLHSGLPTNSVTIITEGKDSSKRVIFWTRE
jgi:hypothetical protein